MITLRLTADTGAVFDASALVPEALAARNVDKLKRIRFACGRESAALGDLFEVHGSASDGIVEIESASPRLQRLGAGLQEGIVHVHGTVGDGLGSELRGGEIHCHGDAGALVGAGMRGGLIDISGNAGDFVGGGLPGATSGMKGGTILVGKTTGARTGDRMRRGLIVVGGAAGACCASQMIAGTVVVLGKVAPGAASGMRRGSLLARDPDIELAPSFVATGRYTLSFITVLSTYVARLKPKWKRKFDAFAAVDRWVGDRGCGGLGEILVAQDARR